MFHLLHYESLNGVLQRKSTEEKTPGAVKQISPITSQERAMHS